MSPELDSLALSVRRSACCRSAGESVVPGRTTGGNGLVAAASFAFIIRRYFPASSRMPANGVKVRTTARSRRPGRGRWELRRRCAAAVRFENSKQKARDGFLRAGFLQFSRRWRYAGDLPDMSNRFRTANQLRKIRRKGFDKLKRFG
jgi:hypothetical protein